MRIFQLGCACMACSILILMVSVQAAASSHIPYADLKSTDAYFEIGYIPMEDNVKLAYILYRPETKGAFPVLLKYNPYWGGGQHIDEEILAYLRHGYAVLCVSIRGTGCSEGVYDCIFDLKQEGRDGAQVVEWAAIQPWSTGAVGMFGNSYPGNVQFMVAAYKPPHLKALAASGLVRDLYPDACYPGGIPNIFLADWTFTTQPRVEQMGVDLRRERGDAACADTVAAQSPNMTYEYVAEHSLHDAWWKSRSIASVVQKTETPTLISQAWQDQQTSVCGATEIYKLLKKQVPTKLILSNGHHDISSFQPFTQERIRWFDHWLRGENNGVEKESPVQIFFETKREVNEAGLYTAAVFSPAWTEEFNDWPIPSTVYKELHLTAEHVLSETALRGTPATGTLKYFYLYGTEIAYPEQMFVAPRSLGAIFYRGEPMTEDLVIVGTPILTLYLSCEQEDTDIMVVLYDIDSTGRTMRLQHGFLRASHRRIDPQKSTPDAPFFPHDKEELLTPGQVYKLTIPFFPIGHVIRKDHRLQLGIMSPNMIPAPEWAFVPKDLPGINTIYHSEKHGSKLTLPVIPGLKAQAAAPTPGALILQPVR